MVNGVTYICGHALPSYIHPEFPSVLLLQHVSYEKVSDEPFDLKDKISNYSELHNCVYFQEAKVPVKEYEFDQKKLANVRSHLVIFHFPSFHDQVILSAGKLTFHYLNLCRRN